MSDATMPHEVFVIWWVGLILTLVFGSTCGDLWLVSRMVKNSYMVGSPAISHREESDVLEIIAICEVDLH